MKYTLFFILIMISTNSYGSDLTPLYQDFNKKRYTPVPSDDRFFPTSEINLEGNLPKNSKETYYRGEGNFVDTFGKEHKIEFYFSKILPIWAKEKIKCHPTCKFYIKSPSVFNDVVDISYSLKEDYNSNPTLGFTSCLSKDTKKKTSPVLYLQFDTKGPFIGALDSYGHSVDTTTLSLENIPLFFGNSGIESSKTNTIINSSGIRLNLGDINTDNGLAYIGSTFNFQMSHNGAKEDKN